MSHDRSDHTAPLGDDRPTRREGVRLLRARLTGIFAGILAGLLVVLVGANTRSVQIDWVVGSTHASLVWIVLVSAATGGIIGLIGGVAIAARARRKHAHPSSPSSP
jgi:uncharacterized integral membrane protein